MPVRPLDAVAPDWDALADRTGAPPFARPGWFSAWSDAFAGGAVEVLVVRRGDRLTGVLPYYSSGGVVRSPTNDQTHHFGLLADDEEAAQELAQALFARRSARVSLGYLDESGPDVPICREAAAAAGYAVATRPIAYNPFVRLDPEPRLPARLVRDVERRRRRLEQHGEVSLEVIEGTEQLEDGLRLEASGWKAAEQTAILSRPDTSRFYRELANWAAERGWLRLCFLRLDERPIAFQLALEHGGAHYFLKGGYHPDYQAFSPGKLLVHATLTSAAERGLRRYELLGDVEPWKLEWAQAVRGRILFEAFRRSPRGLAAFAARRYVRPVLRPDRRARLFDS